MENSILTLITVYRQRRIMYVQYRSALRKCFAASGNLRGLYVTCVHSMIYHRKLVKRDYVLAMISTTRRKNEQRASQIVPRPSTKLALRAYRQRTHLSFTPIVCIDVCTDLGVHSRRHSLIETIDRLLNLQTWRSQKKLGLGFIANRLLETRSRSKKCSPSEIENLLPNCTSSLQKLRILGTDERGQLIAKRLSRFGRKRSLGKHKCALT